MLAFPTLNVCFCSKTFGLKNKNKSAKVQQYVQQMQKTVTNSEKAKQEASTAKKVSNACNKIRNASKPHRLQLGKSTCSMNAS